MFFCIEICYGEEQKIKKNLLVCEETYTGALRVIEEIFQDEYISYIKIEAIDMEDEGICEFKPEEWFIFK